MSGNENKAVERGELLHVYRFRVCAGKNMIGFRSVSGLKLSAAFEPLQVGGMNSGPVLLNAHVKEAGKLTFERGVYMSRKVPKFDLGSVLETPFLVVVLNQLGKEGSTFTVKEPVLESIEYSDLNAMESAILIEKFIVVHQGITVS